MTISIPTSGFKTFKLFLNGTDFTDLVVPESLYYMHQLREKSYAELSFTVRRPPNGFDMRGGQRCVFFLPHCPYPLFCGLALFDVPTKRDPTTWQYMVKAVSWEQVFYRRQIYTNLDNVTFEGAVNQILNDQDTLLPSSIHKTVLNTNDILSEAMGFYSVTGAYVGDFFTWVSQQVSGAWRVVPYAADISTLQVEFYDPNYYSGLRPFRFDNTAKSFSWKTFKPQYNLRDVINSQTVRGAFEPAAAPITCYFRGDDLSSKFPLPTTPYNNTPRLLVYDVFDGNTLDVTNTWLESDVLGNFVFVDSNGFCQFEPNPGNGQWVGITSRAVASRAQKPMAIFDMTWVNNGTMLMGLTDQEAISTISQFLDCGFYTDSNGFVYTIADHMGQGITTLQLVANQVYRFRVSAVATGGCILEYQTGANNFTNNWTVLYQGGTSTVSQLQYAIYTQDAGFSLGIAKMQYPYLGIKLEVDRGQGFAEEFVGISTDQDVDAVIEQNDVLSFFGDNPGPPSIPPAPVAKTFTVIDPTNDKCDVTGGHRIRNGTAVKLATTGTLPAPLAPATTYYLLDVDSFNFKLCTDAGLTSIINITDTGTGVHTVLPNNWVGLGSDYKNIKITYHQGVQINRTYKDYAVINVLQALFGDGDDGIREAPLIQDDNLTTGDAALQRARSEVESRNNIIDQVELETTWTVLQAAGMSCPIVGDAARYNVLVDETTQTISGDLPIQSLQIHGGQGGGDFDFKVVGGAYPKGLREVLKALLDAGQIQAVTDARTLLKNRTTADSVTISDDMANFSGINGYWGDSRFDITMGTLDLTANSILPSGTPKATLADGSPVRASNTGGALPGGLIDWQPYYTHWDGTVYTLFTNQVDAVAGSGASQVDLTSTGSGTNVLKLMGWRWAYHDWKSVFGPVATGYPVVGGGQLDFSDPTQSGFIL